MYIHVLHAGTTTSKAGTARSACGGELWIGSLQRTACASLGEWDFDEENIMTTLERPRLVD